MCISYTYLHCWLPFYESIELLQAVVYGHYITAKGCCLARCEVEGVVRPDAKWKGADNSLSCDIMTIYHSLSWIKCLIKSEHHRVGQDLFSGSPVLHHNTEHHYHLATSGNRHHGRLHHFPSAIHHGNGAHHPCVLIGGGRWTVQERSVSSTNQGVHGVYDHHNNKETMHQTPTTETPGQHQVGTNGVQIK